MADNKDKEHVDKPANTQSESSSNEMIATNEPKTINPYQETENMEIHSHSQTSHGKKNWKSYFWEFLMLFLAVFCGFLAENYRESRAEHQHVQELAAALLGYLQHDTAQLNLLIKYRETKNRNLDSLNFLLQSPLVTIDRNSFYRNFLSTTSIFLFNQASGTVSQLKNAGYLRYFSDDKLIRMISDYQISKYSQAVHLHLNLNYFHILFLKY